MCDARRLAVHDLVGEAIVDFMGSGWMRHLPHCALFIYAAAATLQAEAAREASSKSRRSPATAG